jgi:AcrR family transcriptional regulator
VTDERRPTLRQRQAEELRAAIRSAFVALVLERGATGFSLHDVAAAAGISDRTLYRHYASREVLVEAILAENVAEFERDRRVDPEDTELYGDLERLADTFEHFEEHADLIRALRMLRASGEEDQAATARTKLIRERVAAEGCPPPAVEQLTALLRLLTGSDGWARMREPDLDLDPREAGYAAHWAAQVLIRAAREVEGPLRPEREDDDDGTRH